MPESTLDDAAQVGRRTASPTARRWIGIVACAAAAVIAWILVNPGRDPVPASLRAETAGYHVRLDLDGTSLGRRTATIEVLTKGGRPVDSAEVDLRTAMPTMRMTGAQLRAPQTAPGRYEAAGELFTMLGDWTVIVRVSEPGAGSTQEAAFPVRAVP